MIRRTVCEFERGDKCFDEITEFRKSYWKGSIGLYNEDEDEEKIARVENVLFNNWFDLQDVRELVKFVEMIIEDYKSQRIRHLMFKKSINKKLKYLELFKDVMKVLADDLLHQRQIGHKRGDKNKRLAHQKSLH